VILDILFQSFSELNPSFKLATALVALGFAIRYRAGPAYKSAQSFQIFGSFWSMFLYKIIYEN
jgi:hypothetical protein